MEFSLCCKFQEEKISFRVYTLSAIRKLSREDARRKIFDVVFHNIESLQKSFQFCKEKGIKGFRIASDIVPHQTNLLDLGILTEDDLHQFQSKLSELDTCDRVLSMHPGQFVNMGSPTEEVIFNSVKELKEHLFVAKAVRCGEINFHLGGVYGNKAEAIDRFISTIENAFTREELNYFTLENDEFNYSIEEVVAVCERLQIPAVFDIHHQRVFNNGNGLSHESLESQFLLARSTWKNRDFQRLHISSPKHGFENVRNSRAHADYIQLSDVPRFLLNYSHCIVDVEAKHKEVAVLQLKTQLEIIH